MYLFVRSSTNPGPRVSRVMRYFEELGKATVYLSPRRTGDVPDNSPRDLGILGNYDYFDGSGIFQFLVFLFKVNLEVAKKIYSNRKNLKMVHFSDLEVVLFGGLLCRFFRIPYAYNIHDNFFQRYEFSMVISAFLKYLECFYILLSSVTLVPEMFRKSAYPSTCHKKIEVLRNFPDFDVRTEIKTFETGIVRLFYGGWISQNRNISQYFDLAFALKNRGFKVEMVLCGWGDKNYLKTLHEKFSEHDLGFKYLGQLSQKESVAWLQKSNVSIAYYSPDKTINILAASNKIPEIIGSSTILITNKHTEIAKVLAPLDISLQFDQCVSEIIDPLVDLLSNPKILKGLLERARDFYSKEYTPTKLQLAMDQVFAEILVTD